MGAYSAEDIPLVFDEEGVGWARQLATEGGITVELSHLEPGFQIDDLFAGLPGDRCQCPHWGHVIEGEIVYRTAHGEITARAGQSYYIPPGHLPTTREVACTVVEFSPSDELAETMAVVERNLAGAASAS